MSDELNQKSLTIRIHIFVALVDRLSTVSNYDIGLFYYYLLHGLFNHLSGPWIFLKNYEKSLLLIGVTV